MCVCACVCICMCLCVQGTWGSGRLGTAAEAAVTRAGAVAQGQWRRATRCTGREGMQPPPGRGRRGTGVQREGLPATVTRAAGRRTQMRAVGGGGRGERGTGHGACGGLPHAGSAAEGTATVIGIRNPAARRVPHLQSQAGHVLGTAVGTGAWASGRVVCQHGHMGRRRATGHGPAAGPARRAAGVR